MKTFSAYHSLLVAAALMVQPLLCSCDALNRDDSPGTLSLHFSSHAYMDTKANVELPDTNAFILSVAGPDGKELYRGTYGDSPESFDVAPGNYTITVISTEFKAPKFSSPQYGDKQLVVVSPGTSCSVELLCRQLNSGVKLNVAPNFLDSYPNGSLFLKHSDGKLMYGYSEKRIAYFNPGQVSLVLSNGAKDEILLSRTLESQEILVLNVSAPGGKSSSRSGISIQIDTTRYWSVEDFIIGQEDNKGGDRGSALNVGQARGNAGAEDVWVYGYIVGGDLSSSSMSFSWPFSSRTNIVLASRSSTSDKEGCLSVQLQKGKIRDALNLVDNPENLGKEVFLKGDIVESYYGIPGIQNITEYEFK